jgi:N-acetyl sugar amidotransferase
MTIKALFFCKKCITFSTRPRIKFNEQGICSACTWSIEKKKIDWKQRQKGLEKLFINSKNNEFKKDNYECLVAVSGGKDGAYVAYKLKHKFNKKILTVTVKPPLPTDLGKKNLDAFVESGYDHIFITPNQNAMRVLNLIGFEEMGFPYYGWLISIHTALVRVATKMNIPLIFYSEDGEVEYGGDTKYKNKNFYGIEYMKTHYLEGGYKKIVEMAKKRGVDNNMLYWFTFPNDSIIRKSNIKVSHYSYFENWDSYKNYLIAKTHCGLKENKVLNKGTYTNFSQTDQDLYTLHVYLMYLKFGFGRATQDACIDIRRGSMSREQGLEMIRLFDNYYPKNSINKYLDYYQITKKKFDSILDKWANSNLFEKKKNIWKPKFKVM